MSRPTVEPFTIPDGTYPVIVEVDQVRTVAGWVAGLEYLPDLLEALAAELRAMYAEGLEVRRAARG